MKWIIVSFKWEFTLQANMLDYFFQIWYMVTNIMVFQGMSCQRYKEYCEARKASFCPRLRVNKFREWLLGDESNEVKLTQVSALPTYSATRRISYFLILLDVFRMTECKLHHTMLPMVFVLHENFRERKRKIFLFQTEFSYWLYVILSMFAVQLYQVIWLSVGLRLISVITC